MPAPDVMKSIVVNVKENIRGMSVNEKGSLSRARSKLDQNLKCPQ